jgi:hypothetical protein
MKKVLSIIGIVSIIASCQPNSPQPTTNNGTMICTINNLPWSATTFKNTLELNITDGVDSAKMLELMGKASDGKQLTLRAGTFSNPGQDNMPLGDYLSTSSTLVAAVQYFPNGINSGVSSGYDSGDAEIVITSFNQTNQTCSGTFSFVLKDFETGSVLYTGVNGQFTSLIFTVI